MCPASTLVVPAISSADRIPQRPELVADFIVEQDDVLDHPVVRQARRPVRPDMMEAHRLQRACQTRPDIGRDPIGLVEAG